MTKNDELLTLKEAGAILRCSFKTVGRLVDRGILKGYKPAGTRKVLVKRSELNKYIEGSEVSTS